MSRRVRRRLSALVVLVTTLTGLGVLLGAGTGGRPGRPEGRAVQPESFGALGDGRADDTAALQRALDALLPGETLELRKGKVYRHLDVLVLRRPGTTLRGPGQLLAADEEKSSLSVRAPDVRVERLGLRIAATTRRWDGLDQHRLVLGPHSGITVSRVRVEGSAGAGVFVDGASAFRLDDLVVEGTRADGVHITGGASDGLVRRPVVRSSGDDGVAVVSYAADRGVTRSITIESPRVYGTTWGRGVSVVGGEDVVYRDVRVEDSSAGAVYLATEGAPFFSHSTRRVSVLGAVLVRANRDPAVDHGAVVVSAARSGTEVRGVRLESIRIRDTRPGASRQVGLLDGDGSVLDVELASVSVAGGGEVFQSSAAPGQWRAQGWVVDGRPVDPAAS